MTFLLSLCQIMGWIEKEIKKKKKQSGLHVAYGGVVLLTQGLNGKIYMRLK